MCLKPVLTLSAIQDTRLRTYPIVFSSFRKCNWLAMEHVIQNFGHHKQRSKLKPLAPAKISVVAISCTCGVMCGRKGYGVNVSQFRFTDHVMHRFTILRTWWKRVPSGVVAPTIRLEPSLTRQIWYSAPTTISSTPLSAPAWTSTSRTASSSSTRLITSKTLPVRPLESTSRLMPSRRCASHFVFNSTSNSFVILKCY